MEKFIKHTGTAVPLRRSNVDTDQIIPAVYLKRVTRSGFEDGLFSAWRNDPEGWGGETTCPSWSHYYPLLVQHGLGLESPASDPEASHPEARARALRQLPLPLPRARALRQLPMPPPANSVLHQHSRKWEGCAETWILHSRAPQGRQRHAYYHT